jgi:uncharacterized protein YdeI (YjbR/CyaY-like superfamily)
MNNNQTEQKREIVETRKCGFGGSDAKMFYKVGLKGLSALSDTDKRRIAVALGQAEYIEIPATEAMEAGNKFEKWLGENVYNNKVIWKSNYKLENDWIRPRNFKIFAHADFYCGITNTVVEAKYTSSSLKETVNDYMPQLQLYYILMNGSVFLIKGNQNEQFENYDKQFIERDERYIEILKHGIGLIDDFCDTFVYQEKDEWTTFDLMPHEQAAADVMFNYLSQIKKMEEEVEKQKAIMLDLMLKNGVKSLKSDGYTLTVVPESIRSTFDKAKLLKEHPEINESDYLKTSVVKPYLKITLK